MTIDLPTINSRYRLLDLLGEGGMGAVYRATDRLTGETIALKHVPAHRELDALWTGTKKTIDGLPTFRPHV